MSYVQKDPTQWTQHEAEELPTTIKGSINELRVCVHFLHLGYEVFRNVSPTGKGDIVIWKSGEVPRVIDVKAATEFSYRTKDGAIQSKTQYNRTKCPDVHTVAIKANGEVICSV